MFMPKNPIIQVGALLQILLGQHTHIRQISTNTAGTLPNCMLSAGRQETLLMLGLRIAAYLRLVILSNGFQRAFKKGMSRDQPIVMQVSVEAPLC